MLASQPCATVPLAALSEEPAEATAWMKRDGFVGCVANPLGMSPGYVHPLRLTEAYIPPKN